jgi:hypothetical protein
LVPFVLEIAECLAAAVAMVHLRVFPGSLALDLEKDKGEQQD